MRPMQPQRLVSLLDSYDAAQGWLQSIGIENLQAAHRNLVSLATAGVPLDLLAGICEQFAAVSENLPDPDMALNNLQRYILAARSPMSTAALFERDAQALPNLLLLLTSSQSLSDQLCCDPEGYDHLRVTEGRPVARQVLVGELLAEVQAVGHYDETLAVLRRFKRREMLRIAYGDIVVGHTVAQVTRQLSYVADAIIEAALDSALRQTSAKLAARSGNGRPLPRMVVLGLGKLGGMELNYSSDIDLVILFDAADASRSASAADAAEVATRVSRELIRLLSETTELGFAYRVDMRLRPDGKQGPVCSRADEALAYYDTRGRTWERQAYVKARVVAGDCELGTSVLDQMKPWIYRRYLSLADITGIKALKRKIEKSAETAGVADRNVKTGRGGIRDIEFVIQFLQLLNGGSVPGLQTTNTLEAIVRLEEAGCLNHRERTILEENYAFLREVEHRLQIMFDLQTHEIPTQPDKLTKLARRLNYGATPHQSALEAFQTDFAERTQLNRRILDHLLHDAFPADASSEPEIDLVNDPAPDVEVIRRVLGGYPFRDPVVAYDHLMSLATENIPFLSTRRCRLFLAAIAPRLLAAIAKTPDPDATLVTLSRVSDSLGGKAALWELFSHNHPSLELFVTLCAACPYLVSTLTSNPGMIDELIDSLLITRLPDLERTEAALAELTRGAEDLAPILHSFKNAEHLRVGVRDILGRDDIQETHAALANVAEACLGELIAAESSRLARKVGQPTISASSPGEGEVETLPTWSATAQEAGAPCALIVLALGKLGGREPNYHSDLDLVFLYEAEGYTHHVGRGKSGETTNSHFFNQLGQRIIQAVNHFGPQGRLYEVDARLRPTGKSGSLAVSLESFVNYFHSGSGQLWERLALCKSRVISTPDLAAKRAEAAITEAIYCRPWSAEDARELRQMRAKLEENATPWNLKRGPGGTVDAEFAVQMLQMRHGLEHPEIRLPGTLAALAAVRASGLMDASDAQTLAENYRFLRSVEARIRLMAAAGRHEFPTDAMERAKLAFLLDRQTPEALEEQVTACLRSNRAAFDRVFGDAMRGR
jgi:glutamate-ammonia-ligase adenylyltransferase